MRLLACLLAACQFFLCTSDHGAPHSQPGLAGNDDDDDHPLEPSLDVDQRTTQAVGYTRALGYVSSLVASLAAVTSQRPHRLALQDHVPTTYCSLDLTRELPCPYPVESRP